LTLYFPSCLGLLWASQVVSLPQAASVQLQAIDQAGRGMGTVRVHPEGAVRTRASAGTQ